jgi:CPA2 family monovalent cation:H+ antiporter-2
VHDASFLQELLLVIAIAAAGVALFERLRLPTIAGYLLIGAIVGPGALGLAPDSARVRELAEFGVVFLLFEIGLELPLASLRRTGRAALVAGGLQMLLTLGLVALLSAAAGSDLRAALVLGGLVAMSSTALVVRVLRERGEMDAPHGRLSVSILLFQDLCVVPMMLALPILAAQVPLEPLALGATLAKTAAALVALFLLARFALPVVLDAVARLRSPELFSLVAFLVAGGSAVAADALGLTHAVGAFAAGLVLGSTPYAHQLTAELAPLRGVLLGLFFTAVGMLFDAGAAAHLLPRIAAFVAAVVPLKAAIVYGIATLVMRESPRVALLSGLALAQTGEFSFLLAARALDAGLLADDALQVFVAGSLVSLVATPFCVAAAPRLLARWLTPRSPRAGAAAEGEATRAGHVVVIGFGLTGRTLVRLLRLAHVPHLVIEGNARAVAIARRAGEPIVFGDATRLRVLEHAHVSTARLVAVAISDPVATRAAVSLIRAIAPDVPIVARTHYVAEVDALSAAGATVVVAEELEATLDLVGTSLRTLGVPSEVVARLSDELRAEGYELLRAPTAALLDPWLADLLAEGAPEWMVVPPGPADGRSIAELDIRARAGATVLAHDRAGAVRFNPPPDTRLAAGDRVLVLASAEAGARLRALLATGE